MGIKKYLLLFKYRAIITKYVTAVAMLLDYSNLWLGYRRLYYYI